MAQIEDYDLDVINTLKEFPQNEEDAYLYIRGNLDGITNKLFTFVSIRGARKTLSAAIYSLIRDKESIRKVVYDAVINCVKESPKEEQDYFISILQHNDVSEEKVK